MKKLFLIAGILTIILAKHCFAQSIKVTEGTIKTYKGKILNEIADMNLLIIRDSVVNGTYSLQKNAIPINLSGKINNKKEIQLIELSEQIERKGQFKGKLIDSVFQGKYADSKTKKNGKFKFSEIIPAGSITFSIFSLSSSQKLYEMDKSPKCDQRLTFLFPKHFSNTDVLDSVQKIIKQTYFISLDNSETGQISLSDVRDPEKLLVNQATLLNNGYLIAFPDSIDPNFYYGSQDWDYYFDMAVVANQNNLLSLEFSVYEYTGGAHGNYGNIYKNIDLRTGKSIWLEDIFIDNSDSILNKKITEQVKINYEIEASKSLTYVGFYEDTIAAVSNFYLTTSGIGFFYNPYEIAPYVMGTTDVFIPFSELDSILKKDSLYFMLK